MAIRTLFGAEVTLIRRAIFSDVERLLNRRPDRCDLLAVEDDTLYVVKAMRSSCNEI